MVRMQGMVIIPRRSRWFKAHWAVDTEQFKETCHLDDHIEAIFLHPQGLPFDDGSHGALDTRFVTHDAADLFGVTIADR